MNDALVIIGGGLTAAHAATSAREAGHRGPIIIIGQEPHLPYDRPPLSKQVLRGESAPADTELHDGAYYDSHGIDVLHTTVESIDLQHRRVQISGGPAVAFVSLIIATGARPRQLPVPGADLDGVHYLRTIDDALRLREAILHGARVAVIGAGWIGSEVAASARQMAADVVLIDPAPSPLHRVLGATVGGVFRELHRDHGVHLRFDAAVDRLEGATQVERVVLASGEVIPADVVVVGIGAEPATELAAAARLDVDNGIVVDAQLRTSAPGVYAAGDVASAWHPLYRRHIRVEHWDTAIHQGQIAGANAAGRADDYRRLPYFFSDQYDVGLEYVGHPRPGDACAIRGEPDTRKFIALWHRNGHVNAAMHVNEWDAIDDLRNIVANGHRLSPAMLGDTSIPLTTLAS